MRNWRKTLCVQRIPGHKSVNSRLSPRTRIGVDAWVVAHSRVQYGAVSWEHESLRHIFRHSRTTPLNGAHQCRRPRSGLLPLRRGCSHCCCNQGGHGEEDCLRVTRRFLFGVWVGDSVFLAEGHFVGAFCILASDERKGVVIVFASALVCRPLCPRLR